MHEVLTLDRLSRMGAAEAAALLVVRRSEGAAELDASLLSAWLRADPAHQAAWDDALAAWSDFDGHDDDEILAALRADARWARPEPAGWMRRAAAVAAAVLLVGGGALGIVVQRSGQAKAPVAAVQTPTARPYAVVGDTAQTFQLADGSSMTLAAGAAAAVTLTDTRREIDLQRGRAFFDVAHDARRPFAVRAADQEIVALGTRFDVRLQPGEMRVVLVQGRVSVRRSGDARGVTLEPGQQLLARAGEDPRVSVADLDEAVAWSERYVVFDNATLADAAAELSRLGPDRLIVRDPHVAALRISGRFKAGDLPRFGRSLGLLHPVRLEARGPGVWEIVRIP